MQHSEGQRNQVLDIAIGFCVTAIVILGLLIVGSHEGHQDSSIALNASRVQLAINNTRDISQRVRALESENVLAPAALGATNSVPDVKAFFQTTLASSISSTATSFTLVSATDKAGVTLASSTYAFVIDEGTAKEEMVIADCTSTACTNATRGISPTTGTSSVTTLKFAHGRGASVKITDGPILLILTRIIQGIGLVPNLLNYSSGVTCNAGSSTGALCPKSYMDALANQGAATSTEALGGIVRLATLLQQASSTNLGANAPLVIQSKNATSSPGGTAAALMALILDNAGKIATNAINQAVAYTWSGLHVFTGGLVVNNASTTVTGTLNVAALTIAGNPFTQSFGGDSSDGALTVTSGTTTIALGGATTTIEKNYSSISISAGASLAFSGKPTKGMTIILRAPTCSIAGYINTYGQGADGGAAVGATTNGIVGVDSDDIQDASSHFGAAGQQNSASAVTAGVVMTTTNLAIKYTIATSSLWQRVVYLVPGSGGGSGGESGTGTSGAGGAGGGSLYMECGSLTFTGSINASGVNGGNAVVGSNSGGGGGGGGGGMVVLLYNTLVSNTGTITVRGGAGGAGGSSTGNTTTGDSGGGGGAGFYAGGAGGGGGVQNVNGTAGADATTGSQPGTGGTFGTSDGSSQGGGGGGGGGGSGTSFVSKNLWF